MIQLQMESTIKEKELLLTIPVESANACCEF